MIPSPEKSLGSCTSVILACAVTDLFPNAKLLNSYSGPYWFSYDFFMQAPIGEEALPLIEEKMRELIFQDLPCLPLTSLGSNILEYFHHHGQTYRFVPLDEGLVDLIEIGGFRDLGTLGEIRSTKECAAFKLTGVGCRRGPIQDVEGVTVQIQGVVGKDKKELKAHLKALKEYRQNDPAETVLRKKLLAPVETSMGVEWIWQPKGMELYRKLLEHLRAEWRGGGFQEIFIPSLDIAPYLAFTESEKEKSGEPVKHASRLSLHADTPAVEGEALLSPSCQTVDFCTVFCHREDLRNELISSLQFIQESVRILSFDGIWRLSTPSNFGRADREKEWISLLDEAAESSGVTISRRIAETIRPPALKAGKTKGPFLEYLVPDTLEREWVVSHLGFNPDLNKDDVAAPPSMICFSVFGSWERLVALMLMRHKGCLPDWLST